VLVVQGVFPANAHAAMLPTDRSLLVLAHAHLLALGALPAALFDSTVKLSPGPMLEWNPPLIPWAAPCQSDTSLPGNGRLVAVLAVFRRALCDPAHAEVAVGPLLENLAALVAHKADDPDPAAPVGGLWLGLDRRTPSSEPDAPDPELLALERKRKALMLELGFDQPGSSTSHRKHAPALSSSGSGSGSGSIAAARGKLVPSFGNEDIIHIAIDEGASAPVPCHGLRFAAPITNPLCAHRCLCRCTAD